MGQDFPLLLDAKKRYCKICDTSSMVYGAVDFSVTNNGQFVLDKTYRRIIYNKCPACGTLFTSSFDSWSNEDFAEFVYNDNFQETTHAQGDVYQQSRADVLSMLFGDYKEVVSILDYGGGDSTTEGCLRKGGFRNVQSWDPYYNNTVIEPGKLFDMVTAFEVLEHAVNPIAVISSLIRRLSSDGIVVFSTMVLPDDFDKHGLSWWYVSPRIGHVVIYTYASLQVAFAKFGYSVKSINANWHIAYRAIPNFAGHILPVYSSPSPLQESPIPRAIK